MPDAAAPAPFDETADPLPGEAALVEHEECIHDHGASASEHGISTVKCPEPGCECVGRKVAHTTAPYPFGTGPSTRRIMSRAGVLVGAEARRFETGRDDEHSRDRSRSHR